MIWKSTLIAFILSCMPITGDTKMHLSLLLRELLGSVFLLHWIINKTGWFSRQEVTINSTNSYGSQNPIYTKFQDYLADKFKQKLFSYDLVSKNGDVEFNLKDMHGKKFTDTYKGHTIMLNVTEKSMIATMGSANASRSSRQIVIKSKTATSTIIKMYVQMIMRLKIDNRGLIRVYRPIIRGKKKDEQVISWESVSVQTTKSLSNTAYSDTVLVNLFNDIEYFMNNEQWYTSRGIPYKRGYVIHGTPGCGKTTVSKILATTYDIPVFCLDLTTVKDNTTLIRLMTELNDYVHYKKYILLMEDVEKSDFFSRGNRHGEESNLSMDCLLNVLDGIDEPHGRITIMSANDITELARCPALMRPGRMDKMIKLEYCNKSQIVKLYNMFYETHEYKPNWDQWELHTELTPAFVMKLLQENIHNPSLFMHLIADSIKSDNDSANLDDTFTTAIDTAKKELALTQARNISGSSFMTRIERLRKNRTTKSKIRRAKHLISHYKKIAISTSVSLAKTELRLPVLLEKRKKEKEILLRKKLKKANALRKQKLKLKKQEAAKKAAMEKQIEDDPENDNNEFGTPSFMLNQIEASRIPVGVIATNGDNGDGDDNDNELLGLLFNTDERTSNMLPST